MAGTTIFALSTSAYTDLGVAPAQIQVLTGQARFVVADSQPSDLTTPGLALSPGPPWTIQANDASSHVWGLALTPGSRIAVGNVYAAGGGGGGGTSAAIIAGQQKVAAAATQLSVDSVPLVNGIVVTAKASNTAPVLLGASGVTATYDGTGNGYALAPGASVSLPVSNLDLIYAIGTANDVIAWVGN